MLIYGVCSCWCSKKRFLILDIILVKDSSDDNPCLASNAPLNFVNRFLFNDQGLHQLELRVETWIEKGFNLSGTVGFGLDSLDFRRISSYSNLFHLENLCCRSCLLACDHLYSHCCGLCLYHIGRCYNLYFNIVYQVQFELSHYSLVLLTYDDRQDMTTLLFQHHLLFFALPKVSSRDVVSALRLSWDPTRTSWSSPNHSYDCPSCSK